MKNLISILITIIPLLLSGQFFSQKQFKQDDDEKMLQLAFEANGESKMIFDSIRRSVVLRKSLIDYFADFDSKKAKKGALFSFTSPKGKSSSIAINAGAVYTWNKVTYSVRKKEEHEKKSEKDSYEYKVKYIKFTLGPQVQYDKNTIVDKEQDNLLIGFSYINNLLEYNAFKDSNYRRRFNAPIKISGAYRKDWVNKLKSFQAALYFSPQLNSINQEGELVRDEFIQICKGDSKFKILSDLKLGFEYDYLYSNPSNALNGNFLRSYSKIMVGLGYEKTFTASLSWQHRYAFTKPIGLIKNDYSLLIFRIDATPKIQTDKNFLKSASPTFSIIHESGENPSRGFNDQSYWALALSLAI